MLIRRLGFFAVIATLCTISSGSILVGAGEYIIYTGQDGALRQTPVWFDEILTRPPGQILAPSEANPSANTVEMHSIGSVVPDYVVGGLSENAAVSGNAVSIFGGTAAVAVFGGMSGAGETYGNTVAISSGTMQGPVYGGFSISNAAYNNAVTISGGSVAFSVSGGQSYSGAAYGNSVAISGGTAAEMVYGGASFVDAAYDNKVVISGEALVGSDVVGGASRVEKSAYNNSVVLFGGTVNERVVGGGSMTGSAYGNQVEISGGTVGVYAVGGYTSYDGAVYDNAVSISAGLIKEGVFGGRSDYQGLVYNNSVVVSGGTIEDRVVGGKGDFQAVYANSVVVSGGLVKGSVFGGVSRVDEGDASEDDSNGMVYNNSVVISGGTIEVSVGGGMGGTNTVYNNSVSIDGGTVGDLVAGGFSVEGEVYGNTTAISAGKMENGVSGGWSSENNAYNNTASISGGEIVGPVIGGYSFEASAYGNAVSVSGGTLNDLVVGGASNGAGAAYDNMVTLSGGTVKKNIFGGVVGEAGGTATGNSVAIAGAAEVSAADSMILGGADALWHSSFTDGYVDGDLVSGNTLNFIDWSGSAKTFGNFETVNFVLSATAAAGDTIVTLAEAADFSNMALNQFAGNNPNNISTDISVDFIGGGKLLAAGERITLVNLVDNANHLDGAILSGVKGSLVEYAFKSVVDANALVVEAQSVNANPRSKVLTQSYLVSISLLNRGGDHVASQGISALTDAFLPDLPAGWSRLTAFGSVAGGHEKNKTGSHLSMDSITFLAGVGMKNQSSFGSLAVGAFFEGGYGDYDTTSSIANRASVHGDGDTRYLGGGLLGRLDLQNGLYVEASARIGRVKNKLDSSDLLDSISHAAASYDISDTYYGAHAGVGYLWNINQQSTLDLYGKYFWTHTGGKSLFAANDPVRLDSVNSHRVRLGARYSYAATACVSPYVGAAFEYELDGKSKGSAYNVLRLPDSKLKGATGLGEVGVSGRIGRATVDVGVQGYVGRRQGVNGVLRVGVTF